MLGVPLPRPSSMLKACGLAQFTADIKLEGALELAAVHSTQAHAIIKSIDTSAAEKMPGVVGIVKADDIKGTNRIRGFHPDQPVLCEDVVRYIGDPILAVAAETRDQARAAAAAVKVEYEPLPVIQNAREALAQGAYQIHKQWPNLCFHSIRSKEMPRRRSQISRCDRREILNSDQSPGRPGAGEPALPILKVKEKTLIW